MNKHILVVDDEMEILDFVQPFLNEEGYDVRTTTSGSIVVQHVALDQVDLILLDILLQGRDGRVICRQLKANERTKHIPVILFSAQVSREHALHESLADDFIGKPFDLSELIEVIQKHLP
jgi:DNA-binding response OmpR family regulator